MTTMASGLESMDDMEKRKATLARVSSQFEMLLESSQLPAPLKKGLLELFKGYGDLSQIHGSMLELRAARLRLDKTFRATVDHKDAQTAVPEPEGPP